MSGRRRVCWLALPWLLVGCYVDVMAGLSAPVGSTPSRLEPPAWTVGVVGGVMADVANFTDGEVPFAYSFGYGKHVVRGDVVAEPTDAEASVTERHVIGQWAMGLELGLGHEHLRIANVWWSASAALAFSDEVVDVSGLRDMGASDRKGRGWSVFSGPVLRLGFDNFGVRLYFEATLGATSPDGRALFAGGQVRLRLHDWRVLVVGGLFDGLATARAQVRNDGGGGGGDHERFDIQTRSIDDRNREQQRRVQCGGNGRDAYGVRCP